MKNFYLPLVILFFTVSHECVGQSQTAIVNTSMGSIEIELYDLIAPMLTKAFITLAQRDYYNGLTFHRVLPGFAVIGGMYEPGMKLRNSDMLIKIDAPNDLPRDPYFVAAATSSIAPEEFKGAFYVSTAKNSVNKDVIFGRVLRGSDVVEQISRIPKANNADQQLGQPIAPVIILSVDILNQESGAAQEPNSRRLPGSVIPPSAPTKAVDAVCPTMTARFFDDSRRAIEGNSLQVVLKPKKTDGTLVWTGSVWVDSKNLVSPENALKQYSEWLLMSPKDAEAHRRRAAVYRHLGDLPRAFADYDEAIRIDANHAFAYAGRGVLNRSQKNLEKALSDYDHAIQLDPRNAFFYVLRGNIYSDQLDHAKAIVEYHKALTINPELALVHKNLAAELYVTDKFEESLQHYDKAIRIESDFDLLHDRALVHIAMRNTAKAQRDLQSVLVVDPKNVRCLATTAAIYFANDSMPFALDYINRCIAIESNNHRYFHNRGLIRLKQEKYDDALDDFSRAVAGLPEFAPTQIALARLYAAPKWKQGQQIELAINHGLKAVELTAAQDHNAHSALAYAYAVKGDFEKAVRSQQRALQLSPEKYGQFYKYQADLNDYQAKSIPITLPPMLFE